MRPKEPVAPDGDNVAHQNGAEKADRKCDQHRMNRMARNCGFALHGGSSVAPAYSQLTYQLSERAHKKASNEVLAAYQLGKRHQSRYGVQRHGRTAVSFFCGRHSTAVSKNRHRPYAANERLAR